MDFGGTVAVQLFAHRGILDNDPIRSRPVGVDKPRDRSDGRGGITSITERSEWPDAQSEGGPGAAAGLPGVS
jgi:hypothetical protein